MKAVITLVRYVGTRGEGLSPWMTRAEFDSGEHAPECYDDVERRDFPLSGGCWPPLSPGPRYSDGARLAAARLAPVS